MQRFKDKTVIVTGAASGIGRGVAERFASEGANVVLSDVNEAALNDVAKGLPGERTLARRCDVADYAQVQALVATALERFGRLDVMVNNAGVAAQGSVEDVTLEDWRRTIDIDLGGVFHGCR
ncbi:MAG: SDR family NAD(P)-dependent oxidoreductase, partial [Rhizobiales bacterium]|nr:SDR family NAD(P)-dependent oxidoreductase [Rhizobacter sp.]